jgi:hypothetical protein
VLRAGAQAYWHCTHEWLRGRSASPVEGITRIAGTLAYRFTPQQSDRSGRAAGNWVPGEGARVATAERQKGHRL